MSFALRALGACVLTLTALGLTSASLRAEVLVVPTQFATVQAALNAAVAGDTVLVTKGRYRENVVHSQAFVTLRGASGAVLDGGYTGPGLRVTAPNTVVQGLTLVNGAPGVRVEASNVVLIKLNVSASDGPGILILANSVAVMSCRVTGAKGDGLLVDLSNDSHGSFVLTSRFEQNSGHGIAHASRGHLTAVRNRCERNLGDGISVELDSPSTTEIPRLIQNICRANGGAGLRFDVPAGLEALSNRCEGNAGSGLVGRGAGFLVEKCRLLNNGGAGAELVALSGSTVDGCLASGNRLEGVRFGTAGLFTGSNLVTRSTASRNGRAGFLLEHAPLAVSDSRALDNRGDGFALRGGETASLERLQALRNGHEGLDNDAQVTLADKLKLLKNGGVDLAGAGLGDGSFPESETVVFLTGGPAEEQSLELAGD